MSASSSNTVFRDRINHLFNTTGVTYRQVVKGTRGIVKESYLWQLRYGRAKNPSYKIIAALADYFGVLPGYFFGEDGQNGTEANDIALLIGKLDESERQIVREVIRSIASRRVRRETEPVQDTGLLLHNPSTTVNQP